MNPKTIILCVLIGFLTAAVLVVTGTWIARAICSTVEVQRSAP